MKIGTTTAFASVVFAWSVQIVIAFTICPSVVVDQRSSLTVSSFVQLKSTLAESDGATPATTAEQPKATPSEENVDIPTNLPSECGMDFVPLATMLATGQLAEADQVQKIDLSGADDHWCLVSFG